MTLLHRAKIALSREKLVLRWPLIVVEGQSKGAFVTLGTTKVKR
jgi:hypothetical protein